MVVIPGLCALGQRCTRATIHLMRRFGGSKSPHRQYHGHCADRERRFGCALGSRWRNESPSELRHTIQIRGRDQHTPLSALIFVSHQTLILAKILCVPNGCIAKSRFSRWTIIPMDIIMVTSAFSARLKATQLVGGCITAEGAEAQIPTRIFTVNWTR
jgi:hypothetical protein